MHKLNLSCPVPWARTPLTLTAQGGPIVILLPIVIVIVLAVAWLCVAPHASPASGRAAETGVSNPNASASGQVVVVRTAAQASATLLNSAAVARP